MSWKRLWRDKQQVPAEQVNKGLKRTAEEARELWRYLDGRVGQQERREEFSRHADRIFRKPDYELTHLLPDMYLAYENYLCEETTHPISRVALRDRVARNFPLLTTIDNFGFIIKNEAIVLSLAREFIKALIAECVEVLGQGQGNYLQQLEESVNKLPIAESDAASPDVEYMIRVSNQLATRIEMLLGTTFTQTAYDRAYTRMIDTYRRLSDFPAIISLIPQRFLDYHKISLLSRHQLAEALLAKVKHLEEVRQPLADAMHLLQLLTERLATTAEDTERTALLAGIQQYLTEMQAYLDQDAVNNK